MKHADLQPRVVRLLGMDELTPEQRTDYKRAWQRDYWKRKGATLRKRKQAEKRQ